MGREITISLPINKIVSLVPSQTELLFDLGLGNKIVGRTKFCIHPKPKVSSTQIIGGTKKVHIDRIRALNPDLIIANKEENTKELIAELESDFPVWISDIVSLEDALNMITSLSAILDVEKKGRQISESIKSEFSNLPDFKGKSVLYLIWSKPYMGVGNDTFINAILQKLGLRNELADNPRYPQLSENEIINLNPDVVFLSSEPFPFKTEHIRKLSQILPNKSIIKVNGEMFSWYGSRLLQAPKYFQKLQMRLMEND